MLAQRKEVVRHTVGRTKSRHRRNLLAVLFGNRMLCVILLAVAVSFLLSVYVGAYARAMEKGYHKDDLKSHLRSVQLENESLRLQLDSLRRPDQIEAFAASNDMEQGSPMAYLRQDVRPNVARNIEHGGIR